MKLFGSHQMIHDALKSRLDQLPIHKLCYYQSYYPTDVTIDQLNNILSEHAGAHLNVPNNQDCLGMTPLHILACSSKQYLDLYQLIVTSFPKVLIIEDKWGCPPILYAIWGGVPQGIIKFLVDSQISAFPNFIYDWDKMVETLCRAGASFDMIKVLLDTQHASFADQSINWQKAARELTIRFLVDRDYHGGWREAFSKDWGAMIEACSTSPTYQEIVQSLLETQNRFFSDQSGINLKMVCEELVHPLTGWWRPDKGSLYVSMNVFEFFVRCSIAERLDAIGVRKWRMGIKLLVERISSIDRSKLVDHFDTIHFKLVTYEREYPQLKDTAFLLELALWKREIDESELHNGTVNARGQCRINCGADTIIPNVLPFLTSE